MRRIAKIIGYIFFGLFLSVVIAGWVIGTYYESRIQSIAIEQLNKILHTKVEVRDISFSALKMFPKASIQFHDIKVEEVSNEKEKHNLLEAKSLFLEFNPFDLLTGNYVVDVVHIEQGKIRITKFKDGTTNYNFFKTTGTENFKLELEKVIVVETDFEFRDEINSTFIDAYCNLLTLSGDFQNTAFDLKASCDGKLNALRVKDFKINNKRAFELDILLKVETDKQQLTFQRVDLLFGNLKLDLSGTYQMEDDHEVIDLKFRSKDASLNEISEFLSPGQRQKFSEYVTKGFLTIQGEIKGTISDKENPSIQLSCNLKKGSLRHKKYNFTFDDVTFNGNFSNGKGRNSNTTIITLDTFSYVNELGVNFGHLSISNMENPFLKFDVTASFDLSKIKNIIDNDTIQELAGNAVLSLKAQMHLDSLSSITAKNIQRTNAQGKLKIEKGKIKLAQMPYPISEINSTMRFKQNILEVDSMNFVVEGNKFNITGNFKNLIPFLFFENEKMVSMATLYCEKLNLDKLIPASDGSNSNVAPSFPISEHLSMVLSVHFKNFAFRNFKATDVRGMVKSTHPFIQLQGFEFDALDGYVSGWLDLNFSDLNSVTLETDLTLKAVNIKKLFADCENFGQQAITDKNLNGSANVSLELKSKLGQNFVMNSNETYSRATVEIWNGELNNYKPAMALSKYVNVEELENIKFSKLSNVIEIRERKVFIPEMQVKSSALELKLSGIHSFDNEFEYHFQLWLSDFLFKKASRSKKNRDEFGEVEVDATGRSKLYIKMIGSLDNYDISLDRKAMREKWNQNLVKERGELKRIFTEEFGKEKSQHETKSMQFQLEWEDEKTPADTSGKDAGNDKTETQKRLTEDKQKKSGKRKIGDKIQDEYEEYDVEKFD